MRHLIITLFYVVSLGSLQAQSLKKDESISLLKTYQKELIYLRAQKRNLLKQTVSIEKSFGKKIAKAERQVKKLQDQYIMLSSDNERLINRLSDLERGLENAQMNKELIATTITQAQVSLGLTDDDFVTEENAEKKVMSNEEKLGLVFQRAFTYLSKGEMKTQEPGEFFLANGTKVRGDVLHWGHIARFGTYDKATSMLMPVGGGKFKFAEDQNRTSVAISLDENPSVLQAFIFESADKGIELKKEQTFMEMVEAGGMIAYVIMILGIVALVLMLVRGLMLWFTGKVDQDVVDVLESGSLEGLNEKLQASNTSFARVLLKTHGALDKTIDEREHVIQESILGELNFLDRFGALILVMAAVAPLLGLLGTVTGMISTFDIITEFGTGDPKLLSRGISEALITTKLGLIVAIPTLLVGNLFGGWSSKIKVMLEREALRLSNIAFKNSRKAGDQHA